MVIGKRINHEKKWKLGNLHITECTTYKYLGIVFSQFLNDSTHIKSHLKDKVSCLRGYLRSILSSHDNINRVNFGNSIWKSIILPSISHGCSVWLNNTKESLSLLKSFQYSIARAILCIKSCPAMSVFSANQVGYRLI